MTIVLFAILKDYFPERIFLQGKIVETISDVRQHLVTLNPGALHIISACRFAVDNKFLSDDFKLSEGMEIAVIPPSSGG